MSGIENWESLSENEKNKYKPLFESVIWRKLTNGIIKKAMEKKDETQRKKFLTDWQKRINTIQTYFWDSFLKQWNGMYGLDYNSLEKFSNELNTMVKEENKEIHTQSVLTKPELTDLFNDIQENKSIKEMLRNQLKENITSSQLLQKIPEVQENLRKNWIDKQTSYEVMWKLD